MDPRYSRQTRFAPLGEEGQKKLLGSRVTLIGCGALGSTIADHLVRAGVGFLRIVDRDFVELDNLQRQVLFNEEDVKAQLPKAEAAKGTLSKINSGVRVEAKVVDATYANIGTLIQGADLVMDGTDNFETRFLINDACVKSGVPWIYGGCVGSNGMVMTILPGETACYACMLPDVPPPGSSPTCDTAGVLNTVVAIVAGFQTSEAFKLLTGKKEALRGDLVTLDVWSNQFQSFAVKRQKDCRACGKREFTFLDAKQSGAATTLCGRNAVQVSPASPVAINMAELEKRLSPLGETTRNPYLVRSKIDAYELTIFPDGRAIIKGTDDPAQARSIYSKYVGA